VRDSARHTHTGTPAVRHTHRDTPHVCRRSPPGGEDEEAANDSHDDSDAAWKSLNSVAGQAPETPH
jgi:hypothetical protein